ncbi:MAG: nucleotide exchange factor GrpE [Gammaproteobacteria bacterium]|nr:nucleotide exchange factor GrpE [Gammaproteobacteria bacterium]
MTRQKANAGDSAGAAGELPPAGETAAEPAPQAGTGPAAPASETAPPGAAAGDAAADVEAELSEIDRLRQEIESLKGGLAEYRDQSLRAQAELENFRKRTARDVENAHKYALDRFIAELLPVVDSIDLGIDASVTAGDIEGLREGMNLTRKKFLDTLEKFGVKALDPQGEKFDPDRHEAISTQEVDGAEPGTIITVMQKGYVLNGRLVRPAMVVVAR